MVMLVTYGQVLSGYIFAWSVGGDVFKKVGKSGLVFAQCPSLSDAAVRDCQPYQEMHPSSFFRFNYPSDGLTVTIPVFGAQKGSF